MMLHLYRLIQSIKGPQLYRLHRTESREGYTYQQNAFESLGNAVVKWFRFGWSLSYWMSPFIMIFMYRRGTFSLEGLMSLSNGALYLSVVFTVAVVARAIGRLINKDYTEFLQILHDASPPGKTRHLLDHYDFDFSSWPVDFKWNTAGERKEKSSNTVTTVRGKSLNKINTMPCDILAYIAAHTFGIRLLYPGATSVMNSLLHSFLLEARKKLVEEKGGKRAKLLTEYGDEIDTMHVDRRNNADYPNGDTLVICCEGNAGFYEIGCTGTPMEAGYSVLGWNHPGFGGSTGLPYPPQEQKAADVVMQYAIHQLGYKMENIAVYAWSIGGYPATWLAMSYPDIRFLLLDATFDDVLPLAVLRMPQSWGTLVKRTVKKYLYLNNADQLCQYPGPVMIIRRSRDEMISSGDPNEVSSNRGNFLLKKLLQHRYPKLVVAGVTEEALDEWCSVNKEGQAAMLASLNVEETLCHSILLSYIQENSPSFPMLIGEELADDMKLQLLLYLASKYMDEFDSNHGTPLPAMFFRSPWSLPTAISIESNL